MERTSPSVGDASVIASISAPTASADSMIAIAQSSARSPLTSMTAVDPVARSAAWADVDEIDSVDPSRHETPRTSGRRVSAAASSRAPERTRASIVAASPVTRPAALARLAGDHAFVQHQHVVGERAGVGGRGRGEEDAGARGGRLAEAEVERVEARHGDVAERLVEGEERGGGRGEGEGELDGALLGEREGARVARREAREAERVEDGVDAVARFATGAHGEAHRGADRGRGG